MGRMCPSLFIRCSPPCKSNSLQRWSRAATRAFEFNTGCSLKQPFWSRPPSSTTISRRVGVTRTHCNLPVGELLHKISNINAHEHFFLSKKKRDSYRTFDATLSLLHDIRVSGEIQSPGYPETYPSNATCNWLIRVEPRQRIYIRIVHFNLSATIAECNRASLIVFDGYRHEMVDDEKKVSPFSKVSNQIKSFPISQYFEISMLLFPYQGYIRIALKLEECINLVHSKS